MLFCVSSGPVGINIELIFFQLFFKVFSKKLRDVQTATVS